MTMKSGVKCCAPDQQEPCGPMYVHRTFDSIFLESPSQGYLTSEARTNHAKGTDAFALSALRRVLSAERERC